MKLTIARPTTTILPESEDLPVPINQDNPNEEAISPEDSSKRIQGFLKRGLIPRAIVSECTDNLYLMCSPWNWGIVTELDSFSKYPVRVKWINGKTTCSDGIDLVVVHRGLTDQETKEILTT